LSHNRLKEVKTIIDLVSELLLAAGGFVSTNIENVVILVSVFCANPHNARAVRLGFAIGSLALLFASLTVLIVSGWIPIRFLGLLGLVPIAFGILEIIRASRNNEQSDTNAGEAVQGLTRVVFSASVLMIANGGDTIAVFAPLFAETQPSGVVVLVLGYLATAISLSFLSGHVCVFPKLSGPLKKYGARVAPYIMIGIGVYILLNTGTDLVPDNR
jgi:cadmium resistance protein CadD (predicted permease)